MTQQFRQIPVKVYKSTDAGAPVIQSGILGGIINVLRACLVDGYGGKQGLGWEIPFADTNKITFRSKDPTSNKDFLYVGNTVNNVADVKGYRDMTSISSGTGMFNYQSTTPYVNVSYRDGSWKTPWFLVGHEKAFVLCLFNTQGYRGGSYIYFGDVPSFIAGDTGNTVLCASWSTTSSAGWDSSESGKYGTNFPVFATGIGSIVPYVSKLSYLGCGAGSYQNYDSFDQPISIAASIISVSTSPVYITAYNAHRAIFGGIYYTPAKVEFNEPLFTTNFVYPIKGFEKYLYGFSWYGGSSYYPSGFLVDTVSWTGV